MSSKEFKNSKTDNNILLYYNIYHLWQKLIVVTHRRRFTILINSLNKREMCKKTINICSHISFYSSNFYKKITNFFSSGIDEERSFSIWLLRSRYGLAAIYYPKSRCIRKFDYLFFWGLHILLFSLKIKIYCHRQFV